MFGKRVLWTIRRHNQLGNQPRRFTTLANASIILQFGTKPFIFFSNFVTGLYILRKQKCLNDSEVDLQSSPALQEDKTCNKNRYTLCTVVAFSFVKALIYGNWPFLFWLYTCVQALSLGTSYRKLNIDGSLQERVVDKNGLWTHLIPGFYKCTAKLTQAELKEYVTHQTL